MIASGRSGAIYDGPRSGRPDRNAPFAAIRQISSIAARFGLSLLPPATGPRSATCHRVFLRSYGRVEARASSRSTATPIPPYPVDLRAGNVRNDQGVGRFERDAMLVHWVQDGEEPPSWAEAHRRLQGEGRRSRVKNPTRAHRRFEIRKPWTGGGVALK